MTHRPRPRPCHVASDVTEHSRVPGLREDRVIIIIIIIVIIVIMLFIISIVIVIIVITCENTVSKMETL